MKLSIDTVEEYINNKDWSLTEFIYHFLITLNRDHYTLNNDGTLQCSPNKHRSLGDIFEICKTYYPDTTIEEVKEILLDFGSDLVGHYCPDISKRVYELKSGDYINWNEGDLGKDDEYDDPIEYRVENINKVKYPKMYE